MSLAGSNQTTTPVLHSLKVTQSINGIVIPIVYGQNRVCQNLIWYGDFTSILEPSQGGKGLGKSANQYEYFAAIVGALCQGTVTGIGNIWSSNGRLTLTTITEIYTVPPSGGTYTVTNADRFVFDAGVGASTPFTVPANNYGAPGPTTITGTQSVPQVPTSGTPGPGQYAIPTPGAYVFPAAAAGMPMEITYVYSLYTLAVVEDNTIPLSSPYEITADNAGQFSSDNGVTFILTGQPLINVAGAPTSGTYFVEDGVYVFNSADAGMAVALNYNFTQSDSNIDPSSTLQFTLLEGTLGQAPWGYLVTNHPSQAFGYSTIACMATPSMDLGQSAQLPNYNVEVLAAFQFGAGIVDADAASCIFDLLKNPFYGAQFEGAIDDSLITTARDYWNSNNFFISPVLNASRPCAEIIEEWCEAGNVGTYWSEGLLKFIPYGDTTTVGNGYVFQPQTAPVVDLTDDDYISDGNDDPVQIERTPWQDAYNQVKVQFDNRANDYNPDVVTEQDDCSTEIYGLRPEGQKDYSFICEAVGATFAANIRLKRLVYIRKKYSFKISGLRYCFLEPMDLVTLTDVLLGLNKEPCRILSIEEDDDRTYSVTAEEFPWGTQTATLYPKQPGIPPPPPPSLTDPGDTEVIAIFEPSARVATAVANSAFQVWMALSGGQNWLGCQVWMSYDNISYQLLGTQSGTSRAGTLTADLPDSPDPDLTDTLSVKTTGQLFNVSEAQANAFATLCLVGGLEYVSYANAVLTGSSSNGLTNNYNLSYLRRGIFSSPDIDHPIGSQFIRCDSQLFQYSFDPSLAGKTIYFKFTSFNLLQNRGQSLADVQAYPFTLLGVNTATNMTVDSVLDSGGATADIRIYQTGQAPGTAGTAMLTNGAIINLPAATYTGEETATVYYVNYDVATSAYVIYTDQNQWLADQQTANYVMVGSTTTASNFTFIPLQGGGTIAVGAAQNAAFGSSIPLPPGYTPSNMIAFATPCDGGIHGPQITGVQSSTATGGVLESFFQVRGGGQTQATTNWIALAWTAGAAVTVTTFGVFTRVAFTTAAGDELCFTSGQLANGDPIPVPTGFSGGNWIGLIGAATVVNTGNSLHYIYPPGSSLTPVTLRGSLTYNDNNGNTWGGSMNAFGVFWKSGGGVKLVSVTNGLAITVPLVGSSAIAFIQGVDVHAGDTLGVPAAFVDGSFVIAPAMYGVSNQLGDKVQGWIVEATPTVTAEYYNGSAQGEANLFGIAAI